MAPMVSLSSLTHRVKLCSAKDAVVDGGTVTLARQDALTTWAAIKPKRGSFFVDGVAAMEDREKVSHCITIRFRPDVQISSTAWVYEERRAAPPRWYKVLAIVDREEKGRWTELDVRLVESSDDLVKPEAPVVDRAASLPKGAWF